MDEADEVILGTPVYSANVSAAMQAFLERAAVVCDMNPGMLKHKIGAAVVSLRRGGALKDTEGLANMKNLAENLVWLMKGVNER